MLIDFEKQLSKQDKNRWTKCGIYYI